MKRYSVAEREWILEEFRASGLNRAAFCRREGLCYGTLGRWLTRTAGASATRQESKAVTFMELTDEGLHDEAAPAHGCIEVMLRRGAVVRFASGTDVGVLARFCRELER